MMSGIATAACMSSRAASQIMMANILGKLKLSLFIQYLSSDKDNQKFALTNNLLIL